MAESVSESDQSPPAQAGVPITAAACLVVFFVLMWLPLGHRDFLVEHWMKVGAFFAPLMIFFGLLGRSGRGDSWLRDTRFVAIVLTAAYLVHQVEEHWIDLLGRVYPLYELLNRLLQDAFGDEAYGVMTPEAIFVINTSVVWLAGFLAILLAPRHLFPAVALAGIVLVNGVAHLIQALVSLSYNPGLLTACVLFLPLASAAIWSLLTSREARPMHVGAGIAWGVASHVVLFAGLVASGVFEVIPVWMYYAALVACALAPALMFRSSMVMATRPSGGEITPGESPRPSA
ncbi:MAG: HXXEE domain-containing protein [Planctomycetota bacterium]